MRMAGALVAQLVEHDDGWRVEASWLWDGGTLSLIELLEVVYSEVVEEWRAAGGGGSDRRLFPRFRPNRGAGSSIAPLSVARDPGSPGEPRRVPTPSGGDPARPRGAARGHKGGVS